MNIRPATASDALAIATAHLSSWQAAYLHILPGEFLANLSISDRATRWEKIIDAAESATDVAEDNNTVVAFSSYGRCRDAGAASTRAEIWAIYAAPAAWGKGIGHALLHHSLAALASQGYDETSLWVLSENERGRGFYERNGFTVVAGTEKSFELGGVQVQELQYLRSNAA